MAGLSREQLCPPNAQACIWVPALPEKLWNLEVTGGVGPAGGRGLQAFRLRAGSQPSETLICLRDSYPWPSLGSVARWEGRPDKTPEPGNTLVLMALTSRQSHVSSAWQLPGVRGCSLAGLGWAEALQSTQQPLRTHHLACCFPTRPH